MAIRKVTVEESIVANWLREKRALEKPPQLFCTTGWFLDYLLDEENEMKRAFINLFPPNLS